MRNGDFVPTRLQSQKDCVHVVCNAKLRSHAENTFGVLTMSGQRTSVLMNLTSDIGRIISGIHNIPYEGECDLLNAVQVAQLALKHRQNKQQAQRIVVFVGSPLVKADKDELVKLGKRMKKNNIALDIINFGEIEENRDKLEAFVKAVDNDGNSHIISVPAGPQIILSDVLRQSPIISAAASGASGAAGGEAAAGGFDFDVDPTMDPELAMALKMSLEEEKARQEAQKKAQEPKDAAATSAPAASAPASTSTSAPSSISTPAPATTTPTATVPASSTPADVDMYEDDEIAQAIALSMDKSKEEKKEVPQSTTPGFSTPIQAKIPAASAPPAAPAPPTLTPAPAEVAMTDLDDEDEELKLAMQLSLQASQQPAPSTPSTAASNPTPAATQGSTDLTQQALDPAFMESLLTGLPGVDVNDPSIQNVLASLKGGEKKEEKKEDKK
eukprot:TRINITY_DN2988_c0_g1_i1.p1 TRINITY_DN2988_c0_g1~~TRINITY_DN2988_c0_g1_i1.p1  ORF type:complete len:496 (-),score=170.79 TRINITY_DN2988_c0_g1_i1:200-1525(-)